MIRIEMIAALGTMLLASCTSFEFQRQQILLRYEPETDVLDALLVYEGVGANKANEIAEDAAKLALIAGGRRHFVLLGWPFEFDLEDLVEDLDPEDTLAESFRAFVPDIHVVAVGFARGEEDELCLIQRVRIDHASTGLRLVDQALNRVILREEEREPGSWTREFAPDAKMAELWLERARAGGSWIRFDGRAIVVSLPTTAREAALSLRKILETRDFVGISQGLTAVEISGAEARLRFDPAEDGWIQLRHTAKEHAQWSVAELLAERNLVAAAPLADELRRLMELD